MSVTQLIYASRATTPIDAAELHAITSASSQNNAGRGVTGALLFCAGYFLQLLEGDEAVVKALCEKIGRDPRHGDLQVLSCRTATERLFPDWGMAGLDVEAADHASRKRVRRLTARLAVLASRKGLGDDADALMRGLREAINDAAHVAGV